MAAAMRAKLAQLIKAIESAEVSLPANLPHRPLVSLLTQTLHLAFPRVPNRLAGLGYLQVRGGGETHSP